MNTDNPYAPNVSASSSYAPPKQKEPEVNLNNRKRARSEDDGNDGSDGKRAKGDE